MPILPITIETPAVGGQGQPFDGLPSTDEERAEGLRQPTLVNPLLVATAPAMRPTEYDRSEYAGLPVNCAVFAIMLYCTAIRC
jgi:hypothetical protein